MGGRPCLFPMMLHSCGNSPKARLSDRLIRVEGSPLMGILTIAETCPLLQTNG